MKAHTWTACAAVVFALSAMQLAPERLHAGESAALGLELRYRVETSQGSGRFHTLVKPADWKAYETAVIVCDMWDLHHCLNATRRLLEMAPRMNDVLKEARRRGVLIVHAPSACMEAYQGHPARRRALEAPRAADLPAEIGNWCRQIPEEEKGVYPIDQSDGGEDDDPLEHQLWAARLRALDRDPRGPWKSQVDILEISEEDVISDSGEEIWNVMHERGIRNVILLGVHTNMCVLGRPFGLRQMVRHGKNVVLVRDMTDTMYNPARPPYVSHFTGTDLIVEHIEKWVCPTITSDQLLGGKTFRFASDKRPHLVMLIAEAEYQTEQTLPRFAARHLGKDFRVSLVFGSESDPAEMPGIEVLRDGDVALISVRRRALPQRQMDLVRRFVADGKPVVGVRTANHAFSLRGDPPPEGCAVWEEFDRDVIGGSYAGHHGQGPNTSVTLAEGIADHPILAGVDVSRLTGFGSLYKVSPLREAAKPLLMGIMADKPAEPVAWVNITQRGGRVFYTSLAHPDDFEQPAQNQLLVNALRWAAGRGCD